MQETEVRGISRRRLLANALAGAAAASLPGWFVRQARAAEQEAAAGRRRIGPNDTIQVAGIGLGGSKGGYKQGLNDTRAISRQPGVKIVAVCDVDATHLGEAGTIFGADAAQYKDYHDVLARKDIDAVVIGTPDHWHAIIAIAAMKAGKDVYCEKPLTLTIDEGKQIVKAWRETGAVFQVGSQQRSDARFRLACELVRNGRIGKVTRVTAHLPTGPTGGPFQPEPVPADLDYDRWLGQAPEADYFKQRVHGNFRWFLDYSGGMMTDWGAHHNDIAQWGLGTDRSGPIAVEAVGKRPEPQKDAYDTFPEFDVTYTYPGGVTLLTTNKGENGVQFEGDRGWIFVSRGRIGASDPKLLEEPLPANAVRLYESNNHAANFIDCVRSRRQPICDPEIGHRSATVCHLGNISLRLGGKKLRWDPKREQFVGDSDAGILLKRPERQPYTL